VPVVFYFFLFFTIYFYCPGRPALPCPDPTLPCPYPGINPGQPAGKGRKKKNKTLVLVLAPPGQPAGKGRKKKNKTLVLVLAPPCWPPPVPPQKTLPARNCPTVRAGFAGPLKRGTVASDARTHAQTHTHVVIIN
jgi:hypothetical protein